MVDMSTALQYGGLGLAAFIFVGFLFALKVFLDELARKDKMFMLALEHRDKQLDANNERHSQDMKDHTNASQKILWGLEEVRKSLEKLNGH